MARSVAQLSKMVMAQGSAMAALHKDKAGTSPAVSLNR
jgi:hypothetical protein